MTTSGKVSIASNVLAAGLLVTAWSGFQFPLVLSYETHKLLHITGVMLFMGNLLVGPIWYLLAYFSRDPGALKYGARSLALCDIVCTAPGIQLAVWNGLCLSSAFGGVRQAPWIFQSLILLSGTTLLAPSLVLYWQERVLALSERGEVTSDLTRALVWWSIWGTLVMVPLGLVFYLMITKLALW
jgi:uncharacterized membrane protein